jgi:rfaE bifunctional protein kinase chain/domain
MKMFAPTSEQVSECRILVVGDLMLDRYWHGEVTRISPEAPVPVVRVKSEEIRLGGAGNVALNIQTLGAHTTLLSMVGTDTAALSLRHLLNTSGIKSELVEDSDMDTVVKLRVIGRNQQILRIDFEKEPGQVILASLQARFETLVDQHDVVIFSDYGKGGLTYVAPMIQLAKSAGKPVLVDPKGDNWFRYSEASVITPNRAELAQVVGNWSGEEQLNKKIQVLKQELNIEAVLLTRSEEGMTLFQSDTVNSVYADAREVADVTGAGDTVIATMALMIACGLDLPSAMKFANRAAGVVVARFGTASLTYAELCS